MRFFARRERLHPGAQLTLSEAEDSGADWSRSAFPYSRRLMGNETSTRWLSCVTTGVGWSASRHRMPPSDL